MSDHGSHVSQDSHSPDPPEAAGESNDLLTFPFEHLINLLTFADDHHCHLSRWWEAAAEVYATKSKDLGHQQKRREQFHELATMFIEQVYVPQLGELAEDETPLAEKFGLGPGITRDEFFTGIEKLFGAIFAGKNYIYVAGEERFQIIESRKVDEKEPAWDGDSKLITWKGRVEHFCVKFDNLRAKVSRIRESEARAASAAPSAAANEPKAEPVVEAKVTTEAPAPKVAKKTVPKVTSTREVAPPATKTAAIAHCPTCKQPSNECLCDTEPTAKPKTTKKSKKASPKSCAHCQSVSCSGECYCEQCDHDADECICAATDDGDDDDDDETSSVDSDDPDTSDASPDADSSDSDTPYTDAAKDPKKALKLAQATRRRGKKLNVERMLLANGITASEFDVKDPGQASCAGLIPLMVEHEVKTSQLLDGLKRFSKKANTKHSAQVELIHSVMMQIFVAMKANLKGDSPKVHAELTKLYDSLANKKMALDVSVGDPKLAKELEAINDPETKLNAALRKNLKEARTNLALSQGRVAKPEVDHDAERVKKASKKAKEKEKKKAKAKEKKEKAKAAANNPPATSKPPTTAKSQPNPPTTSKRVAKQSVKKAPPSVDDGESSESE